MRGKRGKRVYDIVLIGTSLMIISIFMKEKNWPLYRLII